MPLVETKYFGSLPYGEDAVFDFPHGLPAFEEEQRFVLMEMKEHEPLVFLQSLTTPELCFLAFPILVVDRDYRLSVSVEDMAALELDPATSLELGRDLLVLTLVSLHDGFSATANLMAPIVISLKTRRGLQAIRQDFEYSHQHRIEPRIPEATC
jgi:flagellar assembly factor FliW